MNGGVQKVGTDTRSGLICQKWLNTLNNFIKGPVE
uniref:Uncharacterized protein n=1 Tax=Anguilla anguilla TaxID=7936 RepID=A0A0E9WQS5_ANGAN